MPKNIICTDCGKPLYTLQMHEDNQTETTEKGGRCSSNAWAKGPC